MPTFSTDLSGIPNGMDHKRTHDPKNSKLEDKVFAPGMTLILLAKEIEEISVILEGAINLSYLIGREPDLPEKAQEHSKLLDEHLLRIRDKLHSVKHG